jgi:hypothetical protein
MSAPKCATQVWLVVPVQYSLLERLPQLEHANPRGVVLLVAAVHAPFCLPCGVFFDSSVDVARQRTTLVHNPDVDWDWYYYYTVLLHNNFHCCLLHVG